jgi:penicillin-binding protein 1C
VPAHQALIRSRNVPAVDLAARLHQPGLYDFLKLAGVQKLAAESHYGLALALGGAELTMEELAQLYAMLPNQGIWQPLRYTQPNEGAGKPLALLSPEAAFITLDMLRQTPRPDTFAPARPAIAWKTGTSWGFRDAWTAGVFGRYVLVVWVGDFDGSSNPAFVGIDAAAPLFLRIVDAHPRRETRPWPDGDGAAAGPAPGRGVRGQRRPARTPNAR